MRTTLNLPDQLIKDLMETTGITNKTLLIRTSLEDMLKRARRRQLLELQGKIDLDLDLDKLREMDMT
jgi:hypothetical protein